MNTIILVTALVLITIMVEFTEGQAGNGGCSCQAVHAEITNIMLNDFGIVKQCKGLGECNCNAITNGNVQTCRDVCEQMVAMWALNDCPMMLRGREVRAQFQSPTCTNAVGIMTTDCGVRQGLCPCHNQVMMAPMAPMSPVAPVAPVAPMAPMANMAPMRMHRPVRFAQGGMFFDN